MDDHLDDTQRLVLEVARELLTERVDPVRLAELEHSETGFDEALWQTFVELGWTSLTVPEGEGGLGGSPLDLGILLEELGRHGVPSPFLQSMTASVLLRRHGDTAGSARVLDRIAAGGAVSFADTAEPERRATGSERGDELIVDGGPFIVEWAHAAEVIVVPVVVPLLFGDGVVLVAVDPASEAVEVELTEAFDNERVAIVRLCATSVGRDSMLTQQPLDPAAWDDERALAHVLRSAEMLGGAERALQLTVDHVGAREQFGVKLATFQAVQHACADMRIALDGARLLVLSALWCAARGLPFGTRARMGAFVTCRAVERVLTTAAQLHGGIGFTSEYPLQIFYRRAKAQSLRLGPTTGQLADIADQILPDDGEPFVSESGRWPVSVPTNA